MWLLVWFVLVGAPQGAAPPQPAPAAAAAQGAASSTCVRCHADLEAEMLEPVKLARNDIHFRNGLSCHDCHGGDPNAGMDSGGPEDSMDPKKGYVGRPDRKRIVALCGSCHSRLEYMRRFNPQARVDQAAEYATSVHGKKYQQGDAKVATCVDCHGAHGVRAASDPLAPVYATNLAATCARCHADPGRMTPYGIPTNQLELYTRSVHGEALIKNRDISAPTCNDCHGNHGAAPPGVDSVANVCGQCHASQWDLFTKSPHRNVFAENQMPACVTCHEHHGIRRTSDAMLGTAEPAVCATCHLDGDAGFKAAIAMRAGIVALDGHLGSARRLLERAERAGMEVSRPLFDLAEGRDRLVLARVEVHRFDVPALQKVLGEGEKIAAAAEASGWRALGDLAYRRKGLAFSAVILLVMIGLVIAKIREIEGRPNGPGSSAGD
jgi:predicted CXXCH cytochrome family protein